ncbi:MAG: hypothetical protein AB7P17_12030 [Nitrospirales bacterium]|nr:hypothetical protein [Nitrospirales bacterium]
MNAELPSFLLACLLVIAAPLSGYGEVWDFNCTEAVSLLKNAQDQVVKKHDQLQQAKFNLRHSPKGFVGCSRNRRGFQGAEIHCIRHQSRQSHVLRDVLVAQRNLESATLNFTKQVQVVTQQCSVSPFQQDRP